MTEWDPLLADLEARRRAARAMGGPERLARQREGGRLDARARVDRFLDPGSFREIGMHAGSVGRGMTPRAPADGLVAGHGAVDGRPVLVGAEDFTVMGGSIGVGTHAKRYRLAQLAWQERVPLVLLLEGTGERSQLASDGRPHAPGDLRALARLRGVVPTVALVMGVSAGHGALTASLTDFVVIVEGAAMFAAGPPVVAAVSGEEVTREELGGAAVHTAVSGVAHNAVPDDPTALALARRYLAFFPSAAGSPLPAGATVDGPRRLDAVLDLVPADFRRPYDVRPVVELLADAGDVLEIQPAFGRSIVTALARLGGIPIAVVANNPAVGAGAIDRDAADKAARFLGAVGPFGLPVVFLADTPGVLPGRAPEHSGLLRAAARMYAAQAAVRGPKLHVTLRRAYGFGASLMGMDPFDGPTTTLAFPGARLGPMPAETGAGAAAIEPDVRGLLEQSELGGAYAAADHMGYDDVIDPRDLRDELLAALVLSRDRP